MQVLVLGLGRTGIGLVRYCLSRGDEVLVYDQDQSVWSRDSVRELLLQGARIWDGQPGRIEIAVASPGIRDDAKPIRLLREHGLEVIDEIEFGYRVVGHKIVAVTGRNGKSTTTTLLGEICRASGMRAFFGGNLAPGLPFSVALSGKPQDIYVLEVSTFQLERCVEFAPRIGVLLNITPDHFDRHGGLEHYVELKFKLFRNQTRDDFAIVNLDDERINSRLKSIPGTVVGFSTMSNRADARIECGVLVFRGEPILSVEELRIPGRHNLANALAATAAARVLGIGTEPIGGVLRSFCGIEHRLETVASIRGVRFVNNSACTNPAAAVASLLAFEQPIVLIMGGREKGLPLESMYQAIAERAKAVVLLGESSSRLAQDLGKTDVRCPIFVEAELRPAVSRAQALAEPGDVVLFSPGFASFDCYRNFQDRGEAFRQVVRDLAQDNARPNALPQGPAPDQRASPLA
ncbi:MAG: UDP-N-acetylmuramoyl-L-alanine--D-glutamate ligase [candidate division WOR-3 bacterium]